MDDLAQWYRAQLDEDERKARAAADTAGSDDWRYKPGDDRVYALQTSPGELWLPLVTEAGSYVGDRLDDEIGVHIVRHDPARVLAEIDAKRQLLDELLPPPREPETDSELHARFAHPAYEYRTTEGPRKQWDDVDLPPCDDLGEPEPGWERNVDAGWDGWERFDYTEESYWRRRLPEGQERKPGVPRWLRLLAAPYADRPGYKEAWRP